jgi:hypothetical protein
MYRKDMRTPQADFALAKLLKTFFNFIPWWRCPQSPASL